jgi:hypothetical protein
MTDYIDRELWQEKLASRLNEETGKIDPMYPLEPPSVGGARPAESKISGKKIKNQDGE